MYFYHVPFQTSRQTLPIFSNYLGSSDVQDKQDLSMTVPYVEQFKFDDVLNRYNERNGMFCAMCMIPNKKFVLRLNTSSFFILNMNF